MPSGSEKVSVQVDAHQLQLSNLGKVLYPQTGLHQGRGHRLLHPHRARPAPPPRRPAADDQALSQRGRREVLLREERGARNTVVGAHGHAARPGLDEEPRHDRLRRRRGAARRWCGWRISRRSSCTSRSGTCPSAPASRAPTCSSSISTRAAGRHREVLRGRRDAARPARRRRHHAVREDVRVEGHAGRRRRSRPTTRSCRRRTPTRSPKELEKAQPEARRVADEEGAAQGQDLRRLVAEQPGEDDGRAVLVAGARPAHRVDSADMGRGRVRRARCASRRPRCSSGSSPTATCSPGRSRTATGRS